MLTTPEINRILDKAYEKFNISPAIEITLETNPDDLTEEKIKALKNETRVNRFSIGIQSFFDDDLVYLNRVHSGKQAFEAIERVKKEGFNNLTIDLIYGIPTLTNEKWKENLNQFFTLDLPHLSSYSLTVEPKTALSTLISKGKMQNIDELESIEHFKILLDETEKRGYIHYEISNFAREGYYSRHNSIYWLGGHYLGLGPSAHSFNGISRQWNVSNMKQYIEADRVENFVAEKEVLTMDQRYNEYVMTSLRTTWGCDTEHISNGFGEKYKAYFDLNTRPFIESGKLIKKGNRYFLTNTGKLFADGIASDLFF